MCVSAGCNAVCWLLLSDPVPTACHDEEPRTLCAKCLSESRCGELVTGELTGVSVFGCTKKVVLTSDYIGGVS